MLAILVVGGPGAEEAEPASAIEVLHARDADEAVEKLGRNRRIDAVLVLDEPAGTVAAIREDIVAPPPIFLPRDAPPVPGARRLEAPGETGALVAAVAAEISGR